VELGNKKDFMWCGLLLVVWSLIQVYYVWERQGRNKQKDTLAEPLSVFFTLCSLFSISFVFSVSWLLGDFIQYYWSKITNQAPFLLSFEYVTFLGLNPNPLSTPFAFLRLTRAWLSNFSPVEYDWDLDWAGERSS
jgi:hypothetical protein